MKKIKNYKVYLKKLKDTFGDIENLPDNKAIQAFIDRNNLYDDWQIVLADVEQDIRTTILLKKSISIQKKQNRITSYKQYLEKLHDSFGIPKSMPSYTKIKEFVDEYELLRIWKVNEDDVSEDIQSFIDGKYEEMYLEATSLNKPDVPVTPKRIFPPVTYHPTNRYSSYTYTSLEQRYGTRSQDSKNLDDEKTLKQKKRVNKKHAVKGLKQEKIDNIKHTVKDKEEKQETIFIDGDNNIKEAQKGIEELSKKVTVIAVFSQEGAKNKFDEKYKNRPNVSSKLVKPGDQAVDNQIKSEVGQLLKKENQDITIVSHDNGFKEYAEKKKNNKGGNHICVIKSVKERKNTKKKTRKCKIRKQKRT